MNIAIITLSTPKKKIGVGIYTDNLLRNLQGLDKDNNYCVFYSSKDLVDFNICEENFKKVNMNVCAQPSIRLVFWQPVLLLKFLFHKIEVVHWTNTMPVLFKVCPTVVTIHDLQEFYTNKYGRVRGFYRKLVNRIAAKLADRIITPSENSKADIVKLLGVSESKVAVIYEGVEGRFRCLEKGRCQAEAAAKYSIRTPYIISVGELHPGKNFVRLIEAFSRLKEKGFGHKLVIVGKKGWRYEDIFEAVERLKLAGEVRFTGYVPDEDLVVLYNGAELCVYPTLYEGFGLPAAEAMACGVPLAAANVGSVPEVVGDAAILFDPYSVDEIFEATAKVLGDDNLSRQMAAKGLEQVKKFSWERMAEETLRVYEGVRRAGKS